MALPIINAPKYRMTIPSTKKEIQFRPYLVKEEKLLMLALESEDDKMMSSSIKEIINSCTFGEVNVDRLALFDVEYIFSQLRAKSVGETSEVSVPCEKCEEANPVTINLEKDIQVTDIPDNKVQLTGDTGLIMKFPSVGEYTDIINSESQNIDKIFLTIASCIDSIYAGDEMFDAKDHTKEELVAFIENLNSDQFNKIRAYLEKAPYAYINVAFKCKKCGHQNEIELKGLGNFFG